MQTLTPIERAQLEELQIRSFSAFVRGVTSQIAPADRSADWEPTSAWEVLESDRSLEWNWHHEVICEELQFAIEHPGEVTQLVLCVPPRHLKSQLASVLWPAWIWLRWPGKRLLAVSNEDSLATTLSGNARRVIQSPWYQRLKARQEILNLHRLPEDVWSLRLDQNAIGKYGTERGGTRESVSANAYITGKGGDIILVDDPYDMKEMLHGSAETVTARMKHIVKSYDGSWQDRLNDPRTGLRVVIMQRLHPDDLAGELLLRRKADPGIRAVVFPTEFDPDFPVELGGIHPRDPRKQPGELLHPGRFTEQGIQSRKSTPELERIFNTVFNQRPSRTRFGMFPAVLWRRYSGTPQSRALLPGAEVILSVDVADTDGASSAETAILVAMRIRLPEGIRFMALDLWTGKVLYPDLERVFLAMVRKWPQASRKLVEDAANGRALLQRLSSSVPGMVSVKPRQSKEQRAQYTLLGCQAGHWLLPEDEHARTPGGISWAQIVIEQHEHFPMGKLKDVVDVFSQASMQWLSEAGDPLSNMKSNLGWLDTLSSQSL